VQQLKQIQSLVTLAQNQINMHVHLKVILKNNTKKFNRYVTRSRSSTIGSDMK